MKVRKTSNFKIITQTSQKTVYLSSSVVTPVLVNHTSHYILESVVKLTTKLKNYVSSH